MPRSTRWMALVFCLAAPALLLAAPKPQTPASSPPQASKPTAQLTGLAAEISQQFPQLGDRLVSRVSFAPGTSSVGTHRASGIEAVPSVGPQVAANERGWPGRRAEHLPAGLSSKTASRQGVRVLFPCTYGDVITAEAGGVKVALRAVGSSNAPALEESGTLAYRDAFPFTDSLQVYKNGRSEEFLRLLSPEAPTTFEYEIVGTEGVTKVELKGGAVRFEGAGSPGVEITAPWLVDAGGTHSAQAVLWSLSGDNASEGRPLRLTLRVNSRGLTYPIVIDPGFAGAGTMTTPRDSHTATLLSDGRVLVAGGFDGTGATSACEVYDPASNGWSDTGISALTYARLSHTATMLRNGKVLVVGGFNGTSYLDKVELFDPGTNTWTTRMHLNIGRAFHTATLLPDGKVLVAGGQIAKSPSDWTSSIEIYDPSLDTWTLDTSHPMASKRAGHTAVLLQNGSILVAGGTPDSTTPLDTAETYTESGGWIATTETMAVARFFHSATVLPDGKVLVAGGTSDGAAPLADSEIYDPNDGSWTPTAAPLSDARLWHTASLLPNGQVLVAGGSSDGANYVPVQSYELYDPIADAWGAIPPDNLAHERQLQTATVLPSGKVLVAGGLDGNDEVATAEIYDPGSWTPYSGGQPSLDSLNKTTLCLGADYISASGSGFEGLAESSGGNGSQSSSTNYPLFQIHSLEDSSDTYLRVDPAHPWSDTAFQSLTLGSTALTLGSAEARIITNGIASAAIPITIASPANITVGTPLDPTAICSGSTASLSVTATGSGLHYQWYQGTAPSTASPVGTDSSNYTTPSLTSTTSYWVQVTGDCGSVDSRTATVTVNQPASISVQPASTSVCSGTGTTLSVTASGYSLSYQWYQGSSGNTSTPLGTSSTQATGNLTTATDFWVRVTGGCGSPADSDTATVSIDAPASITTGSPADPSAICTGTTTTLTVSASGAGLSYQWYRGSASDTSNPVGTDSSSFTTPTLTTTTSYWVRVTGTCGSPADSRTATVTVIPAPSPTISGASANTCPSTSVLLTTEGSMSSYQWYVNSSVIEGATSSTYTATASGTYTVSYSNGCGTGTSAGHAVTISVCLPPPETAPGTGGISTAQSWSGKTTITWPVNADATSGYHVYRGAKADLPNLLNGTTDSCTRATTPDASSNSATGISDDPSGVTGRFYWYLITGLNGTGEGSAGNATAGTRTLNTSGTCP
jgi:hypothetical protein